MRVLLIAFGVVAALSAPATAKDMTPEEWDAMRELYSKIARRHENISHCAATFADKLSTGQIAEFEGITKSTGVEAIADFCAAFVIGVAEGEITYEDVYGELK